MWGTKESFCYKNIMVMLDEDRDLRILSFIDALTDEEREGILSVAEHEGCLAVIWKKEQKNLRCFYKIQDNHYVDVSGDTWLVEHCFIT